MKIHAHKVGAVFYMLWGLMHMLGGAVLLQQLAGAGGIGALANLGSALPATELPTSTPPVVDAVLAFFAWNWIWIGLLVLVVGATLNWRNSRFGYWLNMGVVVAADLGLVVTLLGPGYMALADGWSGPLLWALAAGFSTIGLFHAGAGRANQVALA